MWIHSKSRISTIDLTLSVDGAQRVHRRWNLYCLDFPKSITRASALSHLIISILFYCPPLYPTDTYVSHITREKEGKNVPLKRNCAFAFWGSIIIMHNLPCFITKKFKSGLSRSKLVRHVALPVWSSCAKGCCITTSFTHSFVQASQLLFLFLIRQKTEKVLGQIAEILQLHITVNPECAQSSQFHILFSQRKHSGILNK